MSVQISITGDPGAGKSVFADLLAEKYGIERISAGEMRRNMLQEDILKSNQNQATNAWVDPFIDGRVYEKINDAVSTGRGYVVDARLGFMYAPNSLKIKLLTHPTISAKRVLEAKRPTEESRTFEEALQKIKERQAIEHARWLGNYGIDLEDPKNFDVIIDTSFIDTKEAAEIIDMVIKAKTEGRLFPQFWCHPAQIIPMQPTTRGFNNDLVHGLIDQMQNGDFDFLASAKSDNARMSVCMTPERDLILQEGHHRNAAAIVSSLPYLGVSMYLGEGRPSLSYMYDNYEAVAYFARAHGVKAIYGEPVGDAVLNSFKFGVETRFSQRPSEPNGQAPR